MLNEADFSNRPDASPGELSRLHGVSNAQPNWFAFLSETSEVLFRFQEGTTPWAALATKLVPAIADWCVLSLCDADRSASLITLHREKIALAPLAAFAPSEKWLANPGSREGLEWRSSVARDEASRVPPIIGLTSFISLPLIFRNQYLGRLTLAMSTRRAGFGEHDLQFARELALRIALAADHARLRSEVQRSAENREEMMAVVSHDLKNPLTAILVSASLLNERAKTLDDIQNVKMRRLADGIRHSAERMNGLIGNILDVARLSAGRMPLQPQAVTVGVLIDEIFSNFLPQAMLKNIFLERNVQQSEAVVACDREKIEQVLSNLMANAIQFTPQDGRIVLSASEAADGLGIEFSVSDNGPGMPGDKAGSLWDRMGLPKESARSGTELGLFIARGLIELHGGTMRVESQEGAGSRFCFTLPIS